MAGCDRGPAGTQGSQSPSPPSQPTTTEPLNPDLTRIFRLIQTRKTGPARVQLAKYRKLHPNDGKAVFLFGLTYHREKRYDQAHTHFARAIELDPGYPMTHYFDAWALYYLGELEGSRSAFQSHLSHEPDQADSHFGLGLIDLDEGLLDEAEARFRRAIALQENDPNAARELSKAYARLGDVLVQRDQFEEARAALERSVELFPDHYEAHYMLAQTLLRLGEDEAAERAMAAHREAKQRVRPGTAFPE